MCIRDRSNTAIKGSSYSTIDRILRPKCVGYVTLRQYHRQDRTRRSILTRYKSSRNVNDSALQSTVTGTNNALIRNITLRDYIQRSGFKKKLKVVEDAIALKSAYGSRSRGSRVHQKCNSLDNRVGYSAHLRRETLRTSSESSREVNTIDWAKTPFFQRIAKAEYSLPNSKLDFLNELSIDPLILLLKKATREDATRQAKRAHSTLKYLCIELTGKFNDKEMPKTIPEVIEVLNECKRLFRLRSKLLPIFLFTFDYFVLLAVNNNRDCSRK
eukprot:TRINITY_DN6058_c0_g2_i1.p1 TRINITY_DN6058_c0_g2~~TRINITY_DN6058_c0_g2_i1.p1  ORF type:complete len:271 (+),score=17.12 TRINITY_DN6058_c0_g2_i1:101-913(+)